MHIKQQAKLYFRLFKSLYFWVENWKIKDSVLNGSRHSQVQSALNFLINANLVCYGCSQIFKLYHTFYRFITYLYVVILSCSLFMTCERMLGFSALTSRLISFLVINKAFSFSFIVSMHSPNTLASLAQKESSFNFNPS
jgi:hypothetical protein